MPLNLVLPGNLFGSVSLTTEVPLLTAEPAVLKAIKESKINQVNALVFIGDVIEEDIDDLGHLAGQLGLINTPVFVFQDGGEPVSRMGFEQIARLSNGAYCPFDASSAGQLSELLKAVAIFSAGGRTALEKFGNDVGGKALQITHQILNRK